MARKRRRKSDGEGLALLFNLVGLAVSLIALGVTALGAAVVGIMGAWSERSKALPASPEERKAPLDLAGLIQDEAGLFFLDVKPTEAMEEFPILLPDLPAEPEVIEVTSDASRDVTYELDISALRCTCPDFLSRGSSLPRRDPARCCKHLQRELRKRGVYSQGDQWLEAIEAKGKGWPLNAWLIHLESAPDVLACTSPGNAEWVNVFARTKRKGERIAEASGPIRQFGWSASREGWSFGQGPPGSRELSPIMRSAFICGLVSDL